MSETDSRNFIMGFQRSEADLMAERAEAVLCELRGMSAGLFTAGELFYIQHWSAKPRWGTTVEYEQRLFDEWSALKVEVEVRAPLTGDPQKLARELAAARAERDEKARMIQTMYVVLNEQPEEIREAVMSAIQAKADS